MAPATEPGTLQFDVAYPEHLSRLLIFVKWLLVIPHLIVLAVLLVVLSLTTIGAFFAILITGRYPYSLWTFAFGVMRWMANVTAYATDLQRDEYPPFSMDAGAYPGVRFEMEYPPRLSRGLVLIKWWLLMIPSALVLYVLQAILGVVHLLVFLAILFTGRFPRGLFDFTTGVARWNYRLGAYILLLTDKYPPFSLD